MKGNFINNSKKKKKKSRLDATGGGIKSAQGKQDEYSSKH
jgi:hypothetical protein